MDPILFYDGECGMCQKVVRFSIARDRTGTVRFAPINGVTWRTEVGGDGASAVNTVCFLKDGNLSVRSAAICRLLAHFNWIWRCLGRVLWLIPRPMRDLGYRFVARIRYRIYGRVEACPILVPEHRERFLP